MSVADPIAPAAYDVFLCHNKADKDSVGQIAEVLEIEDGLLFFLDRFGMPPSVEFWSFIADALAKSSCCLVFLSGQGWGPTHLREAQLAVERREQDPNFRLIPVMLTGARDEDWATLFPGKTSPPYHWSDFRGGDDDASIERLRKAIRGELVSEKQNPAILTPYLVRRQAAQWEESGRRDRSLLYRGRQLVNAESIVRNYRGVLSPIVPPFLAACADRQRRFWQSAVVLAVAAAAALAGLSMFALNERDKAIGGQLAANAELAIPESFDLALALAAKGYEFRPNGRSRMALIKTLSAPDRAVRTYVHGHHNSVRRLWLRKERLVVVDLGGLTYIRSATSGKLEYPIIALDGVRSADIGPSGTMLAGGGRNGKIAFVDIPSGKVEWRNTNIALSEITALAFAPQGAYLAAAGDSDLVWFIETATGKILGTLPTQHRYVRNVRFGPRSGLLLTSGWDKVIRVWRVHQTASGIKAVLAGKFEHNGEGYKADFDSQDRYIALQGDADVVVQRMEESAESLEFAQYARFHRVGARATSFAFSPDGARLAVTYDDGIVEVRDLGLQPQSEKRFMMVFAGTADLVTFATNDAVAVVGQRHKVALLDLRRLHPLGFRVDTAHVPKSVAISRDGQTVVYSAERTIHRLALADARAAKEIEPMLNGTIRFMSMSDDGSAVVASDGEKISLVRFGHATPSHLRPSDTGVSALAISPSGTTIAAGSATGHILVWERSRGFASPIRLTIPENPTYALYPNLGFKRVTSLAFEAGERALAVGLAGAVVLAYDFNTQHWRGRDRVADGTLQRLRSFGTMGPVRVAFAWPQRLVATGLEELQFVSPTRTQALSAEIQLRGRVGCLAGSPRMPVVAVCVFPLSAGRIGPGVLRLFDAETAERLGPDLAVAGAGPQEAAISGDGRWLVVSNNTKALWVFRMDADAWRSTAEELAGRRLSDEEQRQFQLQ